MKNITIYEVGDADPTPTGLLKGEWCGVRGEALCMWPAGHDHPQHIVGDGDFIVSVRPVEAAPAPQTREQSATTGQAWLESLTMTSAEGITYTPTIFYADVDGGSLQVGIHVVLSNGDEHDVTLAPSTSTDEGPGTGNVFVHLDDDAQTHFAWDSGPRFYTLSPEQAQRASWEIRDRETGELVVTAQSEKIADAVCFTLNDAQTSTGVDL